ncbi:MAG TPA: hypothetical protein VGF17_12380 [Phytomonospora sp.]
MTPRRWSHWTVRTRMVVMTVAIIAVALTAAIGTAAVLLRGYLTERVDGQLDDTAHFAAGRPPDDGPTRPPGGKGDAAHQLDVPRVYYYDAAGNYLYAQDSNFGETPAQLPGIGELASHAADGEPFTVSDEDGGAWRVEVVNNPDGGYTAVAMSLDGARSTVTRLVVIGGGVSLLILVLLAVGASWIVRIGLRPLTRM